MVRTMPTSPCEALPGFCGEVGTIFSQLVTAAIKACVFQSECTFQKWLQDWLDPYDLWFDRVFTGRPKVGKDSASDSTALFYLPSANPVVAAFGGSIRALEAQGNRLRLHSHAGPGPTLPTGLQQGHG